MVRLLCDNKGFSHFLLPRRERESVITPNSRLLGGQRLVAGRAATTAGLFSLDPSEALHHGFRGLTVVALGILWDSPGRLPASHRPPRAHARNLLIKHCHAPSSLASGETIRGSGLRGQQVGEVGFPGTPSTEVCQLTLVCLSPWRGSKASPNTD